LEILFERSTSPAVNPNWDEGGRDGLAAPFRSRKALAPHDEHIRMLTFRLTKEAATQAALNEGRIPPTPWSAEMRSRSNCWAPHREDLAGFGKVPAPQDLIARRWQHEHRLSGTVGRKRRPENVSDDQRRRFRRRPPIILQPIRRDASTSPVSASLARLVVYSDGYEFDVVFVDVLRELAAMSEGPLTTVGGLLTKAGPYVPLWVDRSDG